MVLIVVALGGALGGGARYAVSELIGPPGGGFPWATLVENLTGALLLALAVTWIRVRHPHRHLLGPFLGAGVLGGYTTFSTFAADTRLLLADGDGGIAGAYLVATLAGGYLAVRVGARVGRTLVGQAP
ncbi:MAG: CrcB family protein [Ilumatobacteraceae bacterium]|jgi:CrcB protein|nr:CrcB family protein [Ilumatobacteraceae bacterium]